MILAVIHRHMTYLLTEPMTHDEQLKVMGICRGAGLGPISFHPDGRVVIYSQAPIADKISLVFPNSRILEILPLPLDTPQYRFQITFIPDRDLPCEVLRFAAHG